MIICKYIFSKLGHFVNVVSRKGPFRLVTVARGKKESCLE